MYVKLLHYKNVLGKQFIKYIFKIKYDNIFYYANEFCELKLTLKMLDTLIEGILQFCIMKNKQIYQYHINTNSNFINI